jgi:acyl carrier protein
MSKGDLYLLVLGAIRSCKKNKSVIDENKASIGESSELFKFPILLDSLEFTTLIVNLEVELDAILEDKDFLTGEIKTINDILEKLKNVCR